MTFPRSSILWLGLLGSCIVATAYVNSDLPVVRNAVTYLKGAYNLLEADSLGTFVGTFELCYGKTIGFTALALPFVAAGAGGKGVVMASLLGTLCLLLAARTFFNRFNARAGLSAKWLPIELSLAVFNPLVFYQSWSGYPDSLFAAVILITLVFWDRLLTNELRAGGIIMCGILVYAAMLTKSYGLILLGMLPAIALARWGDLKRTLAAWTPGTRWICVGVVTALLLLLAGVAMEINPTFSVRNGASMALDTNKTSIHRLDKLAVESALFLLVAFNVASPLLFTPGAWGGEKGRVRSSTSEPIGPRWFGPLADLWIALTVYYGGLLASFGTAYNMRYFIVALPILALALCCALARRQRRTRRALLGITFSVNLVLVLTFNSRAVYALMEPTLLPLMDKEIRGWPLGTYMDNLRMREHLAWNRDLDVLNESLPENAELVIAGWDYYGTALHKTFEWSGDLRSDLQITYADGPEDLPPQTQSVFIFENVRHPWLWKHYSNATVEKAGRALYRVTSAPHGE